MRKKISIKQLEIGMYVDKMDVSWLSSTLFRHQLLVKTQKQLDKIKKAGVKFLIIDTAKGKDVPKKEVEVSVEDKNEKKSKVTLKQFEDIWEIDHHTLVNNTTVDFQLYCMENQQKKEIAQMVDGKIAIDNKILNCKQKFFIMPDDVPKYEAYLKNIARPKILQGDDKDAKNILIRENSKILVKNFFEETETSGELKEYEETIKDLIDAILEGGDSVTELLATDTLGYSVFSHSVNVTVLSLAIGVVEKKSESELNALGMAAMLHDIGKSKIMPKLIRKTPTLLSHMEMMELQQHVEEGKKMLEKMPDIPPETILAVYHHHEMVDGSGYPSGLSYDKICEGGRIIAITDFYDNLTSDRMSKKAARSLDALSYMREHKFEYDMDLFKSFVKIIGSFR